MNQVGFYFLFLRTLCLLRTVLLWGTGDPGDVRLSFSLSDSFAFEGFSPSALGESESEPREMSVALVGPALL